MRLAGRTKLGYYPLPPRLPAPLARLFHMDGSTACFRMLDPCCGEGIALKLIQEELRRQHAAAAGRWATFEASTWGIELDQVRAKAAASQLDHVLATSFFSSTLSTGTGPDRGWQFGYINPIYDDGSENLEGTQSRQEIQFLKRGTERLCDFAPMIWVIPHHVLGRRGVAQYLAEHYDRHVCFRFPDDVWRPPGSAADVGMYAQFRQIIWIGRKVPQPRPVEATLVAQIEAWAHLGEALPPLPLDGVALATPYVIPNAPSAAPVKYFVAGSFDPDAIACQLGQFRASGRPKEGVGASEEFWQARFPRPGEAHHLVGHGLHAFKRGYAISFAVAGLVNRAILCSKTSGRRLLVKGHTRKTVSRTERFEGDTLVEKETERFASSLWGLDLDTCALTLIEVGHTERDRLSWGVAYETMEMQAFLAEFGDSLMEQVQALNAPRYQGPHQVPWAKQAFAYLKRKPLGKQLDAILAQVHALVNPTRFEETNAEPERLARLAEVAEMGSGKTYMAMAAAFLADLDACGCAELAPPGTRRLSLFPLLILSPAIMAPKWKRELEQTLPQARVLIVEHFGPTRGTREEEDSDDRDLRAARSEAGMVDGRTAFRQFDPSFTGSSLGLVGSVDRAVACIQRELAAWRTQYARVVEHNRQVASDKLLPVPLKPTHVLILTFHAARMMPAWMPVWRMKPARVVERESGKVKLLRRRAERPEDEVPILYPACPTCFRVAKDDREVRKVARIVEEGEEPRAAEGRELGLHLLAAEERLQHYLLSIDAYAALAQEQAALQEGNPLDDPPFTRLALDLHACLTSHPEYQRLAAACEQAQTGRDAALMLESRQRVQRFIRDLPVHHAEYRDLLCQQDQRFRDVQREVQERTHALVAELAKTDAQYQALAREVESAADEWRRHRWRREAYEIEARESTLWYLAETDLRGKKDYRVKHTCTECGSPLWQYVAKQPKAYRPSSVQDALPKVKQERPLMIERAGETPLMTHLPQWVASRRGEPLPLPTSEQRPAPVTATWRRAYALGRYLLRRYRGVFGLLVADETHEGADGTALDQARQVLARTCTRMIGLTGTLSNGYASSLFRLYYTLMPSIREEFAYDDTQRWIHLHGKLQTTRKTRVEEPEEGTGSDSARKVSPGMPITREIPGFDATGMGRVARVSSFTELTDVVKHLVKYEENIHIVEMGDVLAPAYEEFQREITRKMQDLLREGDNSGLSPWYHALLTVGDMPWQDYVCQTRDGFLLGKFPRLDETTVWPIETALIRYVQEQHLRGFRVLVYTQHTGAYDEQPRIKWLLERYVRGRGGRRLRVSILRTTSTKRSMDREAWLNREVEAGVDVLICNPALVKVGLDLLAFPKIVYKSFPEKVTDFRQSSRRSWRPGQTGDVEVIILTYQEAMSLRLLRLMSRKTLASFKVEGKIGSEGLVKLGYDEEAEEGDLSGQLAREMLAAFEAGTMTDGKDIAQEVQSLSLDATRTELEQQQRLGEEPDAAAIFLEEIRQVPLVLPPPLDVDTIPSSPSLEVSREPAAAPLPASPALVDASPPAAPNPPVSHKEAPAQVPLVTIVPLPVTMFPNPILAEAGVDAWAELRQLFGVGGKKRKGGSTRKR